MKPALGAWFASRRTRADRALLFAAGLAVATGLTFWLALRATREWQRVRVR